MLGGIMMVAGAGCYVLMWQQKITGWVFLVGALFFSSIQLMQAYEGNSITVKRLKRIQSLADLLFIISGLLMVNDVFGFFRPMFANQIDYINYIYNKWVVLLLIAALLEVYTVHRIDNELSKKD